MMFEQTQTNWFCRWAQSSAMAWVGAVLICAMMMLSPHRQLSANESPDSGDAGDDRPLEAEIILILGARGSEEFDEVFAQSRHSLLGAARMAPAKMHLIDVGQEKNENAGEDAPPAETGDAGTMKSRLVKVFEDLDRDGTLPLWIIMIGHGSYDSVDAKFNLEGPDISSVELSGLLEGITRPTAIVLGFSSSSPFIKPLSGANRVILSATKSGYEMNYARFGHYFADAFTNPEADFDKDDQTSLLEAFIHAAATTRNFYESENRLLTETALIEDNGDGLGTPADWFNGLFIEKDAADGSQTDGLLAHRIILIPSELERSLSLEDRDTRNSLESELRALRKIKSSLTPEEYRSKLENIIGRIARIYFPETTDEPNSNESSTGTDSEPN